MPVIHQVVQQITLILSLCFFVTTVLKKKLFGINAENFKFMLQKRSINQLKITISVHILSQRTQGHQRSPEVNAG